jgi:homoserine O-acetyltransferase
MTVVIKRMQEIAMSAVAVTRKVARNTLAFLGMLLVMVLSAPDAAFAADVAPTPQQFDVAYDNYTLRDGEKLDHLRLHYATLGSPHRDAKGAIDNAVLVLHWTGNSGASMLSPEYVGSLFAKGSPLDATHYYLIFPDNLGHGKSSKPSDGLKARFPHYGYNDLVTLQHRLVTETLGIPRLHAILGVSMGGMNAWQWAEMYPDDVEAIMPVVSLPAKVSGRNLLWRRLAIDDIRKDPSWQGGNYSSPPLGYAQATLLLRMMIDGVPHLQAAIPDTAAAEAFIRAANRSFEGGDANDILYSLESSADYDPLPDLEHIKARVYALNFTDDEFNPDTLQILQTAMPRIKDGRYVVQQGSPQSYGHLTMVHPALWAEHVREFVDWSEGR